MAEREQNEGSGQQPPIGRQDENQIAGQAGQQPTPAQGQEQAAAQGQQPLGQGQQPLGQQGDFGTQEPQAETGGQSATGEAGQGGSATTSEGSEPDLGGGDVGAGGYSPESGASDLGGGETGLGDSGGFIGSQSDESSEYLQRSGNPEAGFAEQGRGAPDQGDVERGTERSENRESDIEGGAA